MMLNGFPNKINNKNPPRPGVIVLKFVAHVYPPRKKDLFHSSKSGYYVTACYRPAINGGCGTWHRDDDTPLPWPDARFGFPWTVKDWDKRHRKRT